MADLKFKVGASLDSSWDTVFGSAIGKAKKARAAIAAEMKAGGQEVGLSLTAGAARASTALEKVGAGAKKTGESLGLVADGARQRFDMLRQGLERLPASLSAVAREAERELARIERQQARASIGLGLPSAPKDPRGAGAWYRAGYMTPRNFAGIGQTLSAGANIARDIAQGAGVDTNLGSLVGNVVRNQALAAQISNSGYMPNGDNEANKHRVSVGEIGSFGKSIEDFAGYKRGAALEGLSAFVGKTGDLDAGRAALKDLAMLSKASGSNLGEMADAAADVSNALGSVPNKGHEIAAVMKVMAGQGKMGAIEIRDLATSMGQLTAMSRKFSVDSHTSKIFRAAGVESETGQAIATLGILGQATRQLGGKLSAREATGAAKAFIADASSSSELKRWGAAGLQTYTDAKHTKVLSPLALIEQALMYSGGSEDKLTKLMPNQKSRAVISAFTGTFTAAGGGTKGIEAVRKQYDEIATSAMSDKEILESFGVAMEQTESKVTDFNNKLQDIVERMSASALPALESAGPGLLKAADHISDFVAWAAQNPWNAANAALAASIAKGGIEQTLKVGVENLFATKLGAMTFGTLAIAAGAVSLGIAAIDAVNADSVADQNNTAENVAKSGNVEARLRRKMAEGTLTADDVTEARRLSGALESTIGQDEANQDKFGSARGFAAHAVYATGIDDSGDAIRELASELKTHREALEKLRQATDAAAGRLNGSGGNKAEVDDGTRFRATPRPGRGMYRD